MDKVERIVVSTFREAIKFLEDPQYRIQSWPYEMLAPLSITILRTVKINPAESIK